MSWLTEWIKNLIFLTVFAAVIEMLLPNNDMKKFVRLLIGLFIVAAILRPLGSILSADLSPTTMFAQAELSQPTLGQGKVISAEKQQALITRIYCQELEAKIKETLLAIPKLDVRQIEVVPDKVPSATEPKVSAEVDSLIKAVYVMASIGKAEKKIEVKLKKDKVEQVLPKEMQDKVKQQLYTVYQLPAEKIFFRYVEVE